MPRPTRGTRSVDCGIVFGFPGRESGLFGTFFELVAGRGGALFDAELRPTMATPDAEHAIDALCRLASRVADLVDWHYDQVDAALLDGRVDAAAAWPGAWDAIRTSEIADQLVPHLYPGGPERRAPTPVATRGRFRGRAPMSTAHEHSSVACSAPSCRRSTPRVEACARTATRSPR